ncbi:hypothetical protein GCM10018966_084530 [Streptomyces yanii]
MGGPARSPGGGGQDRRDKGVRGAGQHTESARKFSPETCASVIGNAALTASGGGVGNAAAMAAGVMVRQPRAASRTAVRDSARSPLNWAFTVRSSTVSPS